MNKQTKNVITLEYITEELRFQNRAAIKSARLSVGVIALICIPIAAKIVYEICISIDSLAVKILLSVIVGTILCAPIGGMLWLLRRVLTEKGMIDRGEFDIVTRDVLYKEERVVQRHTEKYLCFGDLDDVLVGDTVYALADKGDNFYIVHYKNSTRVNLLYSTKTHELKTEENGYGKGQDHP